MMITTKFMGPTNNRGSRVKATAHNGKSKTIAWNHALNTDANHEAARIACVQSCFGDSMDIAKWVMRWQEDGSCVHVGLYNSELKGE